MACSVPQAGCGVADQRPMVLRLEGNGEVEGLRGARREHWAASEEGHGPENAKKPLYFAFKEKNAEMV